MGIMSHFQLIMESKIDGRVENRLWIINDALLLYSIITYVLVNNYNRKLITLETL